VCGSGKLPDGRHSDLDLAARVSRLTPGQRACLELVDDHATSKEIARQLGISRPTVDARLRQAIQILGVSSRREAAIIWRAASGAQPYQSFAYQPSRVEPSGPVADSGAVHQPEGDPLGDALLPESESSDGRVLECHAALAGEPLARLKAELERARTAGSPDALPVDPLVGSGPEGGSRAAVPSVADASGLAWPADWPARPGRAPSLRLWGGANDLTITQRIAGILLVAIIAMLAFGLLLSGLSALAQLRA